MKKEYREGRVEMEPVKAQPKLVRKGSFWVLSSPPGLPPLTRKRVNRTIQEIRQERSRGPR